MVKAYEILKEDEALNADQFWDKLQSDCRITLDAIKQTGSFIFRGYKKVYVPGTVYSSKTRAPIDSTNEMQNMVDKVLALGGFKALRGNSIFCTADYGQASGYGHGNVYLIFPIDGFDVTWSKRYEDFYSDFGSERLDPNSFLVTKEDSLIGFNVTNDPLVFATLDRIEKINFFDKDLDTKEYGLLQRIFYSAATLAYYLKRRDKKTTLHNLEKIFTSYKEYLKISEKKPFVINKSQAKVFQRIYRWAKSPPPELTKEVVRRTINSHQFMHSDLVQAINSDHEMYIRGQFYACPITPESDYFQPLKTRLGFI